MEEDYDQQRQSRGIVTVTSSTVIGRVEGCQRPEETREKIQAARKRKEARRLAEAVHIRQKQLVRGYEEELREVRVERARMKWEWDWAIERGEVAVVVD